MGRPKSTANKKATQKYYEIQKIVEKKVDQHGNVLYRVRWMGYTQDDDTWEPMQHLQRVIKAVEKFQREVSVKLQKCSKSKQKHKKRQNEIFLIKNSLQKQPLPQKTKQIKSQSLKKASLKSQPKPKLLKQNKQKQKLYKLTTSQTTTIQTETQKDKFYLVQKIVGRKYVKKQNKIYYQIKWVGYAANQNTWQPLEHLQNAKQALQIFQRANTKTKQIKKQRKTVKPNTKNPKVIKKSPLAKPKHKPKTTNSKHFSESQSKTCINVNNTNIQQKYQQKQAQYNKTLIMQSALHDTNQIIRVQNQNQNDENINNQTDNYQIGGGICSQSEYIQQNHIQDYNDEQQYNEQLFNQNQQYNDGNDGNEEFISIDLMEQDLFLPDFM